MSPFLHHTLRCLLHTWSHRSAPEQACPFLPAFELAFIELADENLFATNFRLFQGPMALRRLRDGQEVALLKVVGAHLAPESSLVVIGQQSWSSELLQ